MAPEQNLLLFFFFSRKTVETKSRNLRSENKFMMNKFIMSELSALT